MPLDDDGWMIHDRGMMNDPENGCFIHCLITDIATPLNRLFSYWLEYENVVFAMCRLHPVTDFVEEINFISDCKKEIQDCSDQEGLDLAYTFDRIMETVDVANQNHPFKKGTIYEDVFGKHQYVECQLCFQARKNPYTVNSFTVLSDILYDRFSSTALLSTPLMSLTDIGGFKMSILVPVQEIPSLKVQVQKMEKRYPSVIISYHFDLAHPNFMCEPDRDGNVCPTVLV